MFSPGDIVQFVGYGPEFSNWLSEGDFPTKNSVHTVKEVQRCRFSAFKHPKPYYVSTDSFPDFIFWAGYRLLSRPDPAVLLERVPVSVSATLVPVD